MKKLLVLIILVVLANNSFATETLEYYTHLDKLSSIENEALNIGSWVYGGLFAIIGLSGAFMAGNQIFTGQIDMTKALQIIGVTVGLLVILTIINEFIRPTIMSSAKSASQQTIALKSIQQSTSHIVVEEPNKQQYVVKEKDQNNFVYYIIFILFGVYYLEIKTKYKISNILKNRENTQNE